MKITAHTLIKNEARFIWFSVMSVIDFVDEVLLWDDGSQDETQKIIEEILKTPQAKNKISFKKLTQEIGFREDLKRQKMLEATEPGWIIMADGDEIWWEDSIKKVIEEIKQNGNNLESIVVPSINLVGDIYHYQDEAAGKYQLAGKKGHLNLKAINTKIPGLKSYGRNWDWGWVDENNKYVQDRNSNKIKFIDAPYLHASYLRRAGKVGTDNEVFRRNFKKKYELGIPFPEDYYYPEVFFKSRPSIVPLPWEKMDNKFVIKAFFETPLRKIKRRIL